MDDIVVLTMSEFAEPSPKTATAVPIGKAMLVLGGPIRGGNLETEQRSRVGISPSRPISVFAEVVVRHLGVKSPETIFPGHSVQESRFVGFLA